MELIASHLSDLVLIARQIIDFAGDYKIWIIKGDLGAGKTTLIKYLCDEMDVVDSVSSPTFSLINEYQTAKGETIYHFDFYRIETEKEAENLGSEEYFYSGEFCFVEWPEKIPNLIPEQYLEISINFISNKRKFYLTRYGSEDIRDRAVD
ncbi:MAG: tRNA (adenosine(37)-N6)-threonylcarbamoyltransferase complex ATPase subunit type 1 TsaE [Bacteroidetes bacterium]|nr:tRNA (adenosine(37)-N6)-threonylcarbamoyltransferase complex ATPase subunit type 1 TsaE [Bacteroidota bacterium]MDA1119384.1 tRNA (adenosine(37)-N6)-threonylcarbamoyltransferase complex ATPase subunit type 1 TsaE [Bacteroidota bacterium]